MNKHSFTWSEESTSATRNKIKLHDNFCLDFHGNPTQAGLIVFSDGNHHKALLETCQAFQDKHTDVGEVFFITTPPSVLVSILHRGYVTLGNLSIDLQADVFISPEMIMKSLLNDQLIDDYQAFSASKKNSLLVQKTNPKNIQSLNDLLRDDVTLAISHPENEKASYRVYAKTLDNFGKKIAHLGLLETLKHRTVLSQSIHHREIPELIAAGKADVALVYHHLAKSYVERFPEHFATIDYDQDFDDIDVTTTYYCTVVNEQSEYARLFVNFLLSEQGQSIYRQNGLSAPVLNHTY